MTPARCTSHRAFTLLELVLSILLIAILLSILVPALNSGRVSSRKAVCADHLRTIFTACEGCVTELNGQFPEVPSQPGWRWGGVKYSQAMHRPFIDYSRPFNPYIPFQDLTIPAEEIFRCPSDGGIHGATPGAGTDGRTAYEAFGTSYFANPQLFGAHLSRTTYRSEPLRLNNITTPYSRLVLIGDPVWYETYEQTGRDANWHGDIGMGNILFMNGAVKYTAIRPRDERGPEVVEPNLGR